MERQQPTRPVDLVSGGLREINVSNLRRVFHGQLLCGVDAAHLCLHWFSPEDLPQSNPESHTRGELAALSWSK